MSAITQQEFDTILEHSRGMTEMCVDPHRPSSCRLRDGKGGKCFIGCLIPDEEFVSQMEATPLSDLCEERFWCQSGSYSTIRSIHDHNFLRREEKLALFAKDYELRYDAP